MAENQPPRPDAVRAAQTTSRLGEVPPQSPVRVGGRYELGDLIGEGGAARVYYARDTVLDRVVAVKLLREEWSADTDFVGRFYREARAVASLSHPNVIDIYDYGAHDQTYFIAMQLVEGTDLKTILRREGRLAPERAVALTDGLLRGLGAAHERGIIHRDVKPQNLLVRERDGQVKLTDFGVARALSAGQNTAAGTTVGTAHYMAPEQASGGALSPATDLYAVGVVLFEALTGRLPFDGETALQIALQHLRAPVPSLAAVAPDVPPALARVVERALAKEPHDRYPSAEAMRVALHEALAAAGAGAGAALPVAPGATVPLANGAAPGAQTRPLPPFATNPPAPTVAGPAPPQRARPVAARATGSGCFLPLLGLLIVALLVATIVLARSLVSSGVPTATIAAAPSPSAAAGALPTATTVAPTATIPPPTNTAVRPTPMVPIVVPPSDTPVPPTATAVPLTATTAPPTATAVPPTATPVPPTATPVPPTATPVPPTVTPRPPAPTPTPQQSSGNGNGGSGRGQPLKADDIRPEQLQGAYRRDDGRLYGRSTIALYGSGTVYSTGTVSFRAANVPSGDVALVLTGLDDERDARCQLQVVLNGTTIFDGPSTFPNVPTNDNGEGGGSRYWGQMTIRIPSGVLQEGANILILRNRTPGTNIGIPYILINAATFSDGR